MVCRLVESGSASKCIISVMESVTTEPAGEIIAFLAHNRDKAVHQTSGSDTLVYVLSMLLSFVSAANFKTGWIISATAGSLSVVT